MARPPRKPTTTDRVVIYARLSQDQKMDGLGVARQVTECRELADTRGWTVVEVIEENDTSAMKGRRPEFERLLEAYGNSDVAILCWHTDRLVRRTDDLERIIKADFFVHAVVAGTLDLSNPAGKAVARTITAWATYEGEQKTLRQVAKHEQRAFEERRPFLGGPDVFGFIKDKMLGTYVKDPAESAALVEGYEMLLSGVTTGRIAEHWNRLGFTTGHGNAWDYRTAKNVLTAPRNAGILCYREVEIGEGNWEPIVDDITLRSAQLLLNDPERRTTPGPAPSNPLTSLIVCYECGNAARVKTRRDGTASDGPYKVYHCRSGHSSARASWLEEHVVALMAVRVEGGYEAEMSADADESTLALRIERERLRIKGEEYEAALDNDDMTLEQFTRLNKKNRDRKDQITEELTTREVGDAEDLTRDVEDFVAHWNEVLTIEQKRVVARGHVEKIVLMQRGRGVKRDFPGHAQVFIKGNPVPFEVDGRPEGRRLSLVPA